MSIMGNKTFLIIFLFLISACSSVPQNTSNSCRPLRCIIPMFTASPKCPPERLKAPHSSIPLRCHHADVRLFAKLPAPQPQPDATHRLNHKMLHVTQAALGVIAKWWWRRFERSWMRRWSSLMCTSTAITWTWARPWTSSWSLLLLQVAALRWSTELPE